MPLMRVILAVHDSESSLRAVDFAADLLAGRATDLYVVNVIREYCLMSEGLWASARLVCTALSAEMLAAVGRRLEDKGVKSIFPEVCDGNPGLVLPALVRSLNADALIVGVHRPASFFSARWELVLLRRIGCPLIVV